MSCNNCNLCQYSSIRPIPGTGKCKKGIMIINSYADDLDEGRGIATMAPSLLEFMNRLGLKADDYYYTNAIKCRLERGVKIKVTEVKKCKPYLDKEIQEVKPKYVMLIGAQAVKATIDGSITTLNGVAVEKGGITYMPIYSPGIISRDPGKADEVYRALNNFKELLEGQKNELPELNIKICDTVRKLQKAFGEIESKGYKNLSYDIETRGLNRFEDDITLIGFGNDKAQYIIPMEVRFSPNKGKRILQRKLAVEFERLINQPHIKNRIGANMKFDHLFLATKFGIRIQDDFDVVLASHALNENTSNGLKDNAIRELNAPEWDINKNLKTGNLESEVDYGDYTTYLGYDIYYTFKLFKHFRKGLKEDKSTWNIFRHVYMAGSRAYEDIELNGVYIYPKQFKEVRKLLEGRLKEIEGRLAEYKEGVNWSSSAQIKKFLYEELELPVLEQTEAGEPSTSESVLLRLREYHSAVQLILDYRGVKIQISHFVDGWINRMVGRRLFPRFKIHGTVTGRTSCTDPNLQQVPRDPKIRNLVGARPGYSFIEADFSQAELRIAAIMSGDPTIQDIYITGGDIHTQTYELIMNEKVSDDKYIKKEQRKKAKAVNFGFLYGMGWRKFKDYARDTYGVDLSEEEAMEWRQKFFNVYTELPKWHIKQRKLVKAQGYVRSPIGRKRRLPDIYSSEKGKVAEAERQAINSPVQGFGSDLTILGMIELAGHAKYDNGIKLDHSKFHICGTVHDATVFEVRNDYLIEFIPKIKQIMESPAVLRRVFKFESPVPIVVDVQVGKSWGAGIELHMDDDTWKKQVKDYLQTI